MIKKNQNRSKKEYQSPCLEVILLDNHIALGDPSQPPIVEPVSGWDKDNGSGYNKPFPDAPASNSPFGGSSPNYK